MSNLEAHIKIVNEKLQRLLKRNASLQKENQMLNAELDILKEKERDYKTYIDTLTEKVNILQAASGSMSKADQKDLERRIERYISEIDKCITILSE
jgi:chromosome segregation ATPase